MKSDILYSKYSTYLFFIILIISTVADIIDKKTYSCLKETTFDVFFVIVLHHILNIFANFGFLLNNKILLYIYISIPVFISLYWFYFGYCHLSVYVNKECGWKSDLLFNDIFTKISLKSYDIWNNCLHYVFLFFGVIIGIYKIMNFPE